MKMISRTRRIGGSLVVTIPKEVVKEEGIMEGEAVVMEIGKFKKSAFGLLRGMRPFTKEDELDAHE